MGRRGQVRALQELLSRAGFHPGDEDFIYWHFGDTTDLALRYFQAGRRLPETGIADAATWEALLGAEAFARGPEVREELVGDAEDMAADGVYLLGEDRWENPRRLVGRT